MRYRAFISIALLAAALAACQNPAGGDNLPSASFPPTGYEVSGAGSSEVDGYYTASGTFVANLMYRQTGGSYLLFNFWAGADPDRRWLIDNVLPSSTPTLGSLPYYGPPTPSSPEGDYTEGTGLFPGPTVLRMPISGSTAVGSELTAHYIFSDPNGDADLSTFQWQSSSDGITGWTDIGGEISTSYKTKDPDDGSKWFRIRVTPVDDNGDSGTPVLSDPLQIGPSSSSPDNIAPSASFPPTGYQVSGAGSSAVNGNYKVDLIDPEFDGRPLYKQYGGAYLLFNYWAGTDPDIFRHWQFNITTPSSPPALNTIPYYRLSDSISPEEGNYSAGSAVGPGPAVLRTPISGNTLAGNILTASYIFSDPDGDADASTFQWYRFDSDTAITGGTAIPGATSVNYTTVNSDDGGKWLRIEVTPADSRGAVGTPVLSDALQVTASG
jgi:hypothetical protein